jgi:hypothetical protein
MGRGLDGYFLVVSAVGRLCSFEGPRESAGQRALACAGCPVSNNFRWPLRGGNTSSHSEQSS